METPLLYNWIKTYCVTSKRSTQEKMCVLFFSCNGFSLMVRDLVFRVCKTLFPPIPRPPPKYMYFLEKNDGLNVSQKKKSHQCAFRSPHCAAEAFVCVCLSRSIILHQLRRKWSLWFCTSESQRRAARGEGRSYPGKSGWKCLISTASLLVFMPGMCDIIIGMELLKSISYLTF